MTAQPPIIILGVSPRSGTNYLYDLIRLHPEVDIAHTVEEDFLLFGAHHLQDYVDHVSSRWDMGWGMDEGDKAELLESLGQAGLNFLHHRQKFPEKRLLTKTPETNNLEKIFDIFPEAQLIIIVRDGRAVVESKTKSFEADFDNASGRWASAARSILEFRRSTTHSNNFRIIKYEDLYQRIHESVLSLLDFLNLDPTDYPFDQIEDLPVRGSSVFFGSSGKLNWAPVVKTDDFKPMERIKNWSSKQHMEFNLIAGKEMVEFGYRLEEPLYIRPELNQTVYDNEVDVITRLDTGAKVLMPRESARLLMGLDKFQSLRKHFDSGFFMIEELPKFIDFFEICTGEGLLLSDKDFLAALKSPKSSGNAEKCDTDTDTIFIRTCERPVYLERILNSLLKSDVTAAIKIYVLDDSRLPEARAANAEIVSNFSSNYPQTIVYLGESWQQGFICRLIDKFPDYEGVIRYLLQPRSEGIFTAGRLLNLAMLAFAGKRVLTYDDDYIVDRCWQHPEAEDSAVRVTDLKAYCLEGYSAESDMLSKARVLDINPVEEHVNIIGCATSELLNNWGERFSHDVCLNGLGSELINRLRPGSRVLTTGNGVMGRPIAPDALLGWVASTDMTTPVWAGDKNYAAWMEGDHIFSSHKSPAIMSATTGTPVGIDNSQIMPPTIPEGRREDSLFTFLLHRIHPSSVHFEFPWAISHQREPLQWRHATVEQPVALAFAQYLMFSLREEVRPSDGRGTAEASLMTIGAALNEKSTQSDDALFASVLSQFQELTSTHRLKLLDALTREDIDDPAVRSDIERALEVSQNIQSTQNTLPLWEDAHCPGELREQLRWLREHLMLFGQSLLIWPILWAYCKDNPEFVGADFVTESEVAVPQKSA